VDWATLWSVLGAIGITSALSAWVAGYLGGFLPPPPRLVRAIGYATQSWRRCDATAIDAGRYHLVLCGLDGDDAKKGTLRLLRIALNPQDYSRKLLEDMIRGHFVPMSKSCCEI
jgi:hypothetical protein